MIKQIKTGTRNINEGVFLAIYSKRDEVVLMQMREDGKLGFPGGTVDKGESLVTALKREVKEEINLNLDNSQFIDFNLHLISTHRFKIKNGYFHTHLFVINLEENKNYLKKIIVNSVNAEDFFIENRGGFIVSFEDSFFNNFIKNNFAKTVKEELIILKNEYILNDLSKV